MLFNDGQQLQCQSTRTLGAALPFLHRRLAGVKVTGEDRLAHMISLAQRLDISLGRNSDALRHASSKLHKVALFMAPTLKRASTDEWTALKDIVI
jgi:hypothetical protein